MQSGESVQVGSTDPDGVRADKNTTLPISCLACGGSGCGLCRYVNCPICLGTSSSHNNFSVTLQCGHTYCVKCIQEHVQTRMNEGLECSCPLCSSHLCSMDADALGIDQSAMGEGVSQGCCERQEQCRIALHAFKCAARKGHWKICPACGVAITKDGGCDNIRCRCGHLFSWAAAQHVQQCTSIHRNETGVHAWCHTCDGCSPIARAKLAAARTGICLCAIPVLTLVIATATVPAVVFAPLAAIYEPLHMLKISKINPFKAAMVNGPLFVCGCSVCACEAVGILTVEDYNYLSSSSSHIEPEMS